MFFSTFPIWRQNLNFWKRSFYLYWAALLCLLACSAFLVFLTDDIELLWAFTISVFEEIHATCNYFTLLAASHHLINFFPCYMKIYFRRVNTATTTLAFAASETTLSLRTLWPVSCQNWLGFWMQNSKLIFFWPIPCPEWLPPVYLYKLHAESKGFWHLGKFHVRPWHNVHGGNWGLSLIIIFPTLGASLCSHNIWQLLSTPRLGSQSYSPNLSALHSSYTGLEHQAMGPCVTSPNSCFLFNSYFPRCASNSVLSMHPQSFLFSKYSTVEMF